VGATLHENVVPGSLPDNDMDVAAREHMDCDKGVAVTTGMGLTFIIPLFDAAPQPPVKLTV
jgi:hypothetical protein